MAAALKATTGVYGKPAAKLSRARLSQHSALTLLGKAKILTLSHFTIGSRIMDLGHVDVLRTYARHLISTLHKAFTKALAIRALHAAR